MFNPTFSVQPVTHLKQTEIESIRASLPTNGISILEVPYQDEWYTEEGMQRGRLELSPLACYNWLFDILKDGEVVEGFDTSRMGLRRSGVLNRLHVSRYSTYLIGLVETADELIEFAPGRISLYPRLPEYFEAHVRLPAIDRRNHDTMYIKHVFSPPTERTWSLCYEFLKDVPGETPLVWIDTSKQQLGSRTHFMPATNGGALRKIFGPGQGWWGEILKHPRVTDDFRDGLNTLRSSFVSYDLADSEIISLYRRLNHLYYHGDVGPSVAQNPAYVRQFTELVFTHLESALANLK